jgi:hypothetical protein
MAGDDVAQLAAPEDAAVLQQHVTDKMAALQPAEARTRVCAITLLLKEEQASAAALQVEATTAALQVALTTTSSSIVTMLHVLTCGVQNIRYLVSAVLDPSSIGYAHWHDQVLVTLKCYALADHVHSHAPPVNDPAWDRMETVVLSWIFVMITGEFQDITKEHGVAVRQV